MNNIRFAISVANNAIAKVEAYRKFLRKNKYNLKHVKKSGDFLKLPITDKNSYLYKHELRELFPNKKIAPMSYASSGSSGSPTFWFRGDLQEKRAGDLHEQIVRDIYKIDKAQSTLVIVCFSMGVWVAGNYTLAAFREVARRGYNISIITPGVERSDILSSFRVLAPCFKNIILAGYPPFLMDVISEVAKAKIKLPESIKVLTAGDKFSEGWRDQMMKQLKAKETDIVSIYGCADVGVLGFETPASIFIRRIAAKNKNLNHELFGNEEALPALVQYEPNYIYFEEKNNELIFTVDSAIPLVRYNIHDIGYVITQDEMIGILKRCDVRIPKWIGDWDQPYIIKKGRTDVAVTFYALNIYPEHLSIVLNDNKVSKYLTGNYLAYNKELQGHQTQELHFEFELREGVNPSMKLKQMLTETIVKLLSSINTEYRKLSDTIGDKAIPKIQLLKNGKLAQQSKGSRTILNIKGKKPKVIL
ncbi:MAG TPA: hypothetical protein VEC17_03070 [Candidatus Binatia bacterium]|nr:hypothetical protein [Candidatus Binatia bacterium]